MTIQMQRFVLMMFAVVLLALSVAGCKNTARGVGKDVENAGEKIQEKTR
jgi:predicted small secreted protein